MKNKCNSIKKRKILNNMKVFEKSCCQGSWTGEASGLSNEWKLVGMLWGWRGRPAVGVLLGIPRMCCSSRVVCVHSLHRLTVFVPHPIILRCSWTSHSRDPLICEPEGMVMSKI